MTKLVFWLLTFCHSCSDFISVTHSCIISMYVLLIVFRCGVTAIAVCDSQYVSYNWYLHVPTVLKSGSLNVLEPSGPVMGLLYLFFLRISTSTSSSITLLQACLHLSVNSKLFSGNISLVRLHHIYTVFHSEELLKATESHAVITFLFQINTTILIFYDAFYIANIKQVLKKLYIKQLKIL